MHKILINRRTLIKIFIVGPEWYIFYQNAVFILPVEWFSEKMGLNNMPLLHSKENFRILVKSFTKFC